MPKQPTSNKVREIQLRLLKQRQATLKRGNDYVPSKSSIKYNGKASPRTAEMNLRGVPGSSRSSHASMLQEIAARGTGTKVASEEVLRRLGPMRSARNANTTQGNYVTTIVTENNGVVVSDRQGRKVFGR